MPARAVLSLLLLVTAGCSHATNNWSWRRPVQHDQVALPAPPAPRPGTAALAEAGTRRPVLAGPPSYRYGARFEPPDGRMLQGLGSWSDGHDEDLAALGEPAEESAAALFSLSIGDWLRPWESQVERLREQMLAQARLGRVLQLEIELKGIDRETRADIPLDVEVARGDGHDDHLRDLARVVRDAAAPTFVRIGFEFPGDWSYTPIEYPRAFRHVVELFREEGVENAAFVWCWGSSAPGDFDQREQDAWRWYPGDDVVDWFGIDLFDPVAFAAAPEYGKRSAKLENTLHFLDMAQQHGKPVMVSECSAVLVDITPDEQDGRRDWDAWFEPFFAFLAENPGIKAFQYCNTTWKAGQDGDIAHNALIAARYAREMEDPLYLHRADLHLLRGWPVGAPSAAATTVRAPGAGAPTP